MPLTLNQFLLLVLTLVAVIAGTYFVIVLIQIRKTAKEGETSLIEIRKLINNLVETSKKANTTFDSLGKTMEATKKTAVNLSEAEWQIKVPALLK